MSGKSKKIIPVTEVVTTLNSLTKSFENVHIQVKEFLIVQKDVQNTQSF